MYLNTVFKYNVFKYCPALAIANSSRPGEQISKAGAQFIKLTRGVILKPGDLGATFGKFLV